MWKLLMFVSLIVLLNSYSLFTHGLRIRGKIVCKPMHGTSKEECLGKLSTCARMGKPMKWRRPVQCVRKKKGETPPPVPPPVNRPKNRRVELKLSYFSGDNGCQCADFCGYSCQEACDDDSGCEWNYNAGACYYKSGEVGIKRSNCTPRIRVG